MVNLYNKLKKYSLKDAIFFEEEDRQFLALKKLYENKKMDDKNYLFLIILNSLICYQLSGKGENYWEEFSLSLEDKNFNDFEGIFNFFNSFLSNSKNNKRFINTKLNRIKKLDIFYKEFIEKIDFYYKNMEVLLIKLSKIMNQKSDAKTIVFAIKMFSYGARNIFTFNEFPKSITIPIDSRLEKLYKKYSNIDLEKSINNKEIKKYYSNLSEKLKISELHLDAIVWVNYDNLIK